MPILLSRRATGRSRLQRPGAPVSSKKRQAGAETVEFLLTLLLFFVVLYLIVDMSVLMFDQGIANQAARSAARQGSLFWVDPADFDPANPSLPLPTKVKEAMLQTAVDYYEDNALLNPGGDAMELDPNNLLSGADSYTGSAPNRIWSGVSEATVNVNLTYPHDYIGLTRLLSAAGATLGSSTGLDTEADL